MNDWNKKQKIARIEREIAHFTAQVDRFSNAQNPREKAAFTLSRRKLEQRAREIAAIKIEEAL